MIGAIHGNYIRKYKDKIISIRDLFKTSITEVIKTMNKA